MTRTENLELLKMVRKKQKELRGTTERLEKAELESNEKHGEAFENLHAHYQRTDHLLWLKEQLQRMLREPYYQEWVPMEAVAKSIANA